ncbi:SICAvar, type I (fragment) [Plasmodium knowlesi strain H]|uniref:SICAvar, type I n=1 Tax=Plasmodium knowlesi (strain H) TaxID=5851 RepID=A0A1A7VVD9_PLAKH
MKDFWEKGGEVEQLWNQLSGAITTEGKTDHSECKTMDDGTAGATREATDPEKKACNYLHAGLTKLYTTDTASTPSTATTTSSSSTPLLSNPLLKQTVGCLLLNAYAKKMKEDSKCVIDSGIQKAFKAFNDNNTTCKDNGTKPCVPCEWKETEYDECTITTTGSSGNSTESAKDKLKQVQTDINRISNFNLKDINSMTTLCDYIRCAGPKWFKRQKAASKNGGTTKTWCDFWENDGVKPEVEKLFKHISSKNTSMTTYCKDFGDGNADSVERKACNHITAGLDYINQVLVTQNGNTDDDKFFKRNMMCAALNLYADKIKEESTKKCPIDEERIKKMFTNWNVFNRFSSLSSSSTSCKSGVYGCFECKRVPTSEYNGCELSVSSSLINPTSSSPTGTCKTKETEVKTQIDGLLKDDKTTIKMEEKLSDITEMTTFCSELQCAARKWNMTKNQKGTAPSWSTLSTINKMDSFCSKMQCAAKQYAKMQNGGQPKTTLSWSTLSTINKMDSFCSKMQCAAKQYYVKVKNKNDPTGNSSKVSWDEISGVVDEQLKKLLEHITDVDKWKDVAAHCDNVGSKDDTPGEITAKKKACKLFALGLKHISKINDDQQKGDGPLKRTMACAALNLYADQLINKSTDQCPLDNEKLDQAIKYAFDNNNSNATKSGANSCKTGSGTSSCFICNRENKFHTCKIGSDEIKKNMDTLLEQNKGETRVKEALEQVNKIENFCTQVQCAIKQHYRTKNGPTLPKGKPSWSDIEGDAKDALKQLLEQMTKGQTESYVVNLCKDNPTWSNKGHKERRTNKAACLLFASGLKHIYDRKKGQVNGRGSGHTMGPVKDPSFEQTMGCLFIKEYVKQLKEMAKIKKRGNSWVHPLCDIDKGIEYAFGKSGEIMKSVLSECREGPNGISCFECKIDQDYDNCKIGNDEVQEQVKPLLETKGDSMQQTLENTVCPILLTDLLTPFLPLAPVSIGLSAMAYYLWKYFGPLGKGGARFRRSPTEIPGSSVQEQVYDHVQQEAGPHEYRLVKERKPRSVPTRTKRSGGVNRRTIIEIHFEVLDECQKGDTQLNQKDFLELLVQEFMGSELMEEEQVPKEEVLMEGVPLERVPMENVPMERVPSLGSGLMV